MYGYWKTLQTTRSICESVLNPLNPPKGDFKSLNARFPNGDRRFLTALNKEGVLCPVELRYAK